MGAARSDRIKTCVHVPATFISAPQHMCAGALITASIFAIANVVVRHGTIARVRVGYVGASKNLIQP